MTRIYRYVVRYDHGVAPCVQAGLCSLAICKPAIRRTAREGDLILGFASVAQAHEAGRLLFAMVVGAKLPLQDYMGLHPDRRDAIYDADGNHRVDDDHFDMHGNASDQARDWRGRNALLGERYWYFGSDPRRLPPELEHLVYAKRGHKLRDARPSDWNDVVRWLDEVKTGSTRRQRLTRASRRLGACR